MALRGRRRRCPSVGLIHHADRGSRYCSIEYQAELRKKTASRSRCRARETASTTPWSRRLQDPQDRTRLAHHLSEPVKQRSQSAVTSTASTIPSAAIRRSTSSARFSSKGGQRKIENALHKCRVIHGRPRDFRARIELLKLDFAQEGETGEYVLTNTSTWKEWWVVISG